MKLFTVLMLLLTGVCFTTSVVHAYDVSVLYGFDWTYSCQDTDTLFKTATIYINDTAYNLNQTVECSNGCSNSTLNCNPSTFDNNLVLIAIAFLVIGMVVAGVKLPEIVGLPVLMISIVFTGYFLSMDFFTGTFKVILATFIILEILASFYVMKFVNDDRSSE